MKPRTAYDHFWKFEVSFLNSLGSDYPRPKLSMLSAHAKFAEIYGDYATRNHFKLFENFIKIRDKKG
jgi:hypothetical protein